MKDVSLKVEYEFTIIKVHMSMGFIKPWGISDYQNCYFFSSMTKIDAVLMFMTENISMTQLSSHTFAHLTGSSFKLKFKLLPIKNILGVKYN